MKVLDPADFIIMKLRRGTNHDIDDALSVALKQNIEPEKLYNLYREVLRYSIKDTSLFNFKKFFKTLLNCTKTD